MSHTLVRCKTLLLLAVAALPATTINVPGIRPNYTATGADLAGLKVTIVWDFGATGNPPGLNSFMYTWIVTGPSSGATNNSPPPPFSPILTLSGNSASSQFVFSGYYADPVVSITLDGTSAGILFDRAFPSPGTSGTGPQPGVRKRKARLQAESPALLWLITTSKTGETAPWRSRLGQGSGLFRLELKKSGKLALGGFFLLQFVALLF